MIYSASVNVCRHEIYIAHLKDKDVHMLNRYREFNFYQDFQKCWLTDRAILVHCAIRHEIQCYPVAISLNRQSTTVVKYLVKRNTSVLLRNV